MADVLRLAATVLVALSSSFSLSACVTEKVERPGSQDGGVFRVATAGTVAAFSGFDDGSTPAPDAGVSVTVGGRQTTRGLRGSTRTGFGLQGQSAFGPLAGLAGALEIERPVEPVTTWRRSALAPNATRLAVGDGDELPLEGVQATVRIDGFRARVVLDCYYLNDRGRAFEGTFQLRLPDEGSPFLFAFGETAYRAPEVPPFLDSRTATATVALAPERIVAARTASFETVKEARVVPKEKAAHAYRETVHTRRVDPALVEWQGAGVFSARVFPLASGKLHRITFGYDVDLTAAGGNLEYRLDLPEAARRCVVDLDIAMLGDEAPRIAPEAPASRDGGRVRCRLEDPSPRTLTVRSRRPEGALALAGGDPRTGDYFAVSLTPDLPVNAEVGGRAVPARAVLAIDVSRSSNPDRLEVWLALLESILERNRDALREFAVLFFDIETRWWRASFAANTPENVRAVLEHARTLAPEGATDLGAALDEATRPPWLRPDEGGGHDVFLLSDGAATWGETDAGAIARSARNRGRPIFAYDTGLAGTDRPVLDALARESCGAVFTVAGAAEVAAAATDHRARPFRLAKVALAGASDLLVAGRPRALFPRQPLLVVGRGPAPEPGAALTLELADADGSVRHVTARIGPVVRSDLAARAYGQVAVAQLEALDDATGPLSKAYATHFRVPGRTCSLLMLETEADYARFQIEPDEDAVVVRMRPAGQALARAFRALDDAIGDPKARFLAWLARLERGLGPGLTVDLPAAVRLGLEGLPPEAFELPRPAGLAGHEKARDLRALSSRVEEAPGDLVVARDVAYRALAFGLAPHAHGLFRRAALARPFEPQVYVDLARALAALGRGDLALAAYEVALAGRFDDRFGDRRRIVGAEYVRFLRLVAAGRVHAAGTDLAAARLETLAKEVAVDDADLVVVIEWSTDATDVDLHVIEPSGEDCHYGHRRTKQGGELTRDVTGGYGPEMYVLRRAAPGAYAIRVHDYRPDANRTSARTTVHATVYRGFGRPDESVAEHVVELAQGREMHDIATVAIVPE